MPGMRTQRGLEAVRGLLGGEHRPGRGGSVRARALDVRRAAWESALLFRRRRMYGMRTA